jgi:RNA polymerase sigma factor (sigma-70 family)
VKLSLDEAPVLSDRRAAELLALDDALRGLEAIAPRKSRVVELRFFGGLTNEEVAEVLDVSPRTVRREWDLAQAWLYREMSRKEAPGDRSVRVG